MQSLARPLDLRSALVGLGLAGSLMLLTSLAVPTPPVKTMRISLDPEPSSIVRVHEGESFQVPQKLRLVLKAAGTTGGGLGAIDLKINGVTVLLSNGADPVGAFPFPIVAQPGDVVSVGEPFPDPNNIPFATGYLSE